MRDSFYLPVISQDRTTHVQVSVYHTKTRKALTLSVYPAEAQGDGVYSIPLMQGESTTLEPMPRFNRKRAETAQKQAETEVRTKNGPAWTFVQNFLQTKNLQPNW